MWDNSVFNHNQTFLSGRGLQAETECGLYSTRQATCSWFSGHQSCLALPRSPLPLRPFRAEPQMCDTVIFNYLCDSTSLLNLHARVCACVYVCPWTTNPIILKSVLPPTGWAWYRQWHLKTPSPVIRHLHSLTSFLDTPIKHMAAFRNQDRYC